MLQILATLVTAATAVLEPPIDIGDRIQPMVDRHLVSSIDGLDLRLATPRDQGEVFRFDQPWEGPFCAYATVIHDGDRYLLYYRGLPTAGKDLTTREVTCLATSEDGRGRPSAASRSTAHERTTRSSRMPPRSPTTSAPSRTLVPGYPPISGSRPWGARRTPA